MWSIFPGDNHSDLALVAEKLSEFFCLRRFATTIGSLEDDELSWEFGDA